ncbi:xanthine dehydrogenase family protein molybdopterin-binding subunit [Azospirillum rugosum]|uniref:Xanthine dehydrogenase YagR molybdenum-binding subunit n=1 Tax=Azospirillum rugosum TaxID=416170 RepID=A0ABS4SUI7_9PROT|nr:xanthine dehydrogenase family protein molybdopterin-binding subunit [Azospirillum rugosum]MBP2296233.1 xanthine dehydrogenase YagR molybdenum-binding subunit [Azospirillum rugosum]MDQ0529754.1 xanthine dehydrogenase YagR molybdenum-binding subunit [Azospirillum rugosum]
MIAKPSIPDVLTEPGAHIGRPARRVDGRLKVTGGAKYAAEFSTPGLAHGYIVSSTIARGRITRIDASAALALPGVLHVFTHENRPSLAWFDRKWKDEDAPKGSPFRPLYDAEIIHSLQPVALVVADSFELARYAARLVEVEYEAAPHRTDLHAHRDDTYTPGKDKGGFEPPPKPRGDADKALAEAEMTVDLEFTQATEHHNPMEMHASTVVHHEDGTLTVYDKTQGAQNSHTWICNVFDLPKSGVRVLSPFVGGAFGSGLRPQHQLFMAVLAATQLKRSVRVELSRPQMFSFGHRPETIQRVALGASRDGTLTALIHEAVQESSQNENYVEVVVNWSGQQYKCDNVRLDYKLCRLDVHTPLDQRAPGAATGVPAIEIAMDELAHKLGMDPIELRLKNYTDVDPNTGNPFSSKELRACFAQGAERFGWAGRNPTPRSMRDGRQLIGWGMAAGVWDAMQGQAVAKAKLGIDGKLVVGSATADIGTGTYTVMTQIAADILGLPLDDVAFHLGDSSLPMAPIEGGSWTVSSVGSAVKAACDRVRDRLVGLAIKMDDGPLAGIGNEEVILADGHLAARADPSRRVSITAVMRAAGLLTIEEEARSIPYYLARSRHTLATHSAVFAEVRVDEDLGTVQVTRVVSAVAAGRIINPKTAASQIMGAVVWGIGMALEEETLTDHTLGRYVNHDIAEYHIPVNADVHDIDVIFVEEHDDLVNPLGAKGVGEIGIVGVPAAISNAIFHATGVRVRDLPITVDKILSGLAGGRG